MDENKFTLNKAFLPIMMVIQFFFTVTGGGMLIAGIIAGCKYNWDLTLENNICKIAVLLTVFGGFLFVIGVCLIILLLIMAKNQKEK